MAAPVSDEENMEAQNNAIAQLRRAAIINTALNILFISDFCVTAALIWKQPAHWLQWSIFGFLVLFTLSKFRLMFKYLGVYPPEYCQGIQGSPILVLTNLKGCILFPIMAIVLAAFPPTTGFYFAAMVYFVGSALWSPVFHVVSYKLIYAGMLTEKGKRIMPLTAYSKAWGSFQNWILCSILLTLWRTYGFSGEFWHFLWITFGICIAITLVQLGVIRFLIRSREK